MSFGLSGKDYGKKTGSDRLSDIEKRRADPVNFLFVAGMWFQDLFNYDSSGVLKCASSPMQHRWAKFPSAPITLASVGGTLLKTCSKRTP